MGCFVYQLRCCCGPNGCSSLCIGPIRESSTTRLVYSLMLIIVSIILVISHENKLIQWAAHEFQPGFNNTCMYIKADLNCLRLKGYKSIYRIAFPFFFFHLAMGLLCIYSVSSRGWRSRVHNGFWFIKIIVIVLLWTVLYLIPAFEKIMLIPTIIGVIGAFIFIIIQHVSLIDCAYEFNGYLRDRSSRNCCFSILLYVITGFLYIATTFAYVLIYFNFAVPRLCVMNRVVIIVNAAASVILIIFSFVGNSHHQFKLYIPGGVTCLFVAFLTWTAISSAPDILIPIQPLVKGSFQGRVRSYDNKNQILICQPENKFLDSHFGKELHAYLGIVIMLVTSVYASIRSTVNYKRYGIKPSRSKLNSLQQLSVIQEDVEMQELNKKSKHRISGSFILSPLGDIKKSAFKYNSMPNVNVLSSSFNTKASVQVSKLNKNAKGNTGQSNSVATTRKFARKRTRSDSVLDKKHSFTNLGLIEEDLVDNVQAFPIDEYLIHDEYFEVRYSYSWFHFIFALAYLFVMVQLTNWYSPEESHRLKLSGTWPSMWMKITTSWVALALYGWSLVCPAFCIGRKLYEFPFDSMKRYRKPVTNNNNP